MSMSIFSLFSQQSARSHTIDTLKKMQQMIDHISDANERDFLDRLAKYLEGRNMESSYPFFDVLNVNAETIDQRRQYFESLVYCCVYWAGCREQKEKLLKEGQKRFPGGRLHDLLAKEHNRMCRDSAGDSVSVPTSPVIRVGA